MGGVEKPATPPTDVLWASEWMSTLEVGNPPAPPRPVPGSAAPMVFHASPRECVPIEGSPVLWSELRWAARAEGVVHLDDLLLRRTRIGLLLPAGVNTCSSGSDHSPRQSWVEAMSAGRARVERYLGIWKGAYGPARPTGRELSRSALESPEDEAWSRWWGASSS